MFRSLVLSGGGLKGVVHLGKMCYLIETNQLDLTKIKYIVGTSIGAIIGLLLNIGYHPLDIFIELQKHNNLLNFDSKYNFSLTEYETLSLDGFLNIIKLFLNFMRGDGLLSLDRFIHLIELMIVDKMDSIPTLYELYNTTNKVLIIAAYNKTKRIEEYFSYKTHPNLLCSDLIQMSASVQIIFKPNLYNGCLYEDGGILANYPIKALFDINDSEPILGIRFETKVEQSIPTLISTIWEVISVPIERIDDLMAEECKRRKNIKDIKIKVSSPFLLGANPTMIQSLFDIGYLDEAVSLTNSSTRLSDTFTDKA